MATQLQQPVNSKENFSFGDIDVFPKYNKIFNRKTNKEINLPPKLIQLLVTLASKPCEPISKKELLNIVWPETYVSESAIVRAIADLRKILGDSAKTPRYIKTISKKGYLLDCDVTALTSAKKLETRPFSNTSKIAISLILIIFFLAILSTYERKPAFKPILISKPVAMERNQNIFRRPRISADENYLIFIEIDRAKKLSNIVMLDLKSNHRRTLFQDTHENIAVDFIGKSNNSFVVRTEGENECLIYQYSVINNTKHSYIPCKNSASPSIDASEEKRIITQERNSQGSITTHYVDFSKKKLFELDTTFNQSTFFSRHSPDGKKIVSTTGQGGIHIYNKNSTDSSSLTLQGYIAQVLWWNNEYIIISVNSGEDSGIWLYHVESRKLKNISSLVLTDSEISLSTKNLYYTRIKNNFCISRYAPEQNVFTEKNCSLLTDSSSRNGYYNQLDITFSSFYHQKWFDSFERSNLISELEEKQYQVKGEVYDNNSNTLYFLIKDRDNNIIFKSKDRINYHEVIRFNGNISAINYFNGEFAWIEKAANQSKVYKLTKNLKILKLASGQFSSVRSTTDGVWLSSLHKSGHKFINIDNKGSIIKSIYLNKKIQAKHINWQVFGDSIYFIPKLARGEVWRVNINSQTSQLVEQLKDKISNPIRAIGLFISGEGVVSLKYNEILESGLYRASILDHSE